MDFDVKANSLKDGIIMYCTENQNGYGDFASFAIKDKSFEFRFDTGSGPAILKSSVKVELGQWYHINIVRKKKEGRLKINNETWIEGKSQGRTRGLNIQSHVFFGGIDRKLTNKVLFRPMPCFTLLFKNAEHILEMLWGCFGTGHALPLPWLWSYVGNAFSMLTTAS